MLNAPKHGFWPIDRRPNFYPSGGTAELQRKRKSASKNLFSLTSVPF